MPPAVLVRSAAYLHQAADRGRADDRAAAAALSRSTRRRCPRWCGRWASSRRRRSGARPAPDHRVRAGGRCMSRPTPSSIAPSRRCKRRWRPGAFPAACSASSIATAARAIRVDRLGAARARRSAPMTEDTWFDLASLTKVIFTTPRILALAEAGTIDLDAPLISVLPDFRQYNADAWERKVTFRQCLGHQTPFPGVVPIYTYGRDPDLLRAFVLQREWPAGPAGLFRHQLHPARLRAGAPERADRSATWIPVRASPGPPIRTAPRRPRTAPGAIACCRGEVHDDNCSALQGAGHAGLFGTAGFGARFRAGAARRHRRVRDARSR